jgi:beta-phosphoglucomutase-like phosphatase (HAD superfamily)
MFFLIDLDGTLLDTDYLHYQAWAKVLKLSPEYIEKVVTTHGINYILEDFPDPSYLRRQKIKEMLQFEEIKPMKNLETFIHFIVENNIDHTVVTNTDRKVVEHFKQKVPILNKLKKWIVREDYEKPKPDPECYRLALGDRDDIVFGFENSKEGLEALSKVTGNIFHIHPETDYLKVIDHIKIQCPKRFGMHPINLNHMGKKKLRPSKLAFAMAGSLALVIALQNLKSGYLTSSERNMDSL